MTTLIAAAAIMTAQSSANQTVNPLTPVNYPVNPRRRAGLVRRNNAGIWRHFTSSTGTGDRWMTLFATEPSTRFDTKPAPRVPITIWSQPFSLA